MVNRCPQVAVMLICALLNGTDVWSQESPPRPGRLVTGMLIDRMKTAILQEFLRIENGTQRKLLLSPDISAVYVPETTARKFVYLCTAESTEPVAIELSDQDFIRLQQYVKDKIHEALAQVRTSKSESDRAEAIRKLKEELNSLLGDKRKGATMVVGYALADMAPLDRDLRGFVETYGDTVRAETLSSIKDPSVANALAAGQPYSVGTSVVRISDIQSIKPGDVKKFAVGDQEFKSTWIGPSWVIVRQDSANKPILPFFSNDKTGLGVTALHHNEPAAVNRATRVTEFPAIQ